MKVNLIYYAGNSKYKQNAETVKKTDTAQTKR